MADEYWRRRAFAGASLAGLDRYERIELAEMLLKSDLASWKGLTETDFQRLSDALEGHHLVSSLIAQRHPRAVLPLPKSDEAENLWSPESDPEPRVVDAEGSARFE